MSTRDEERAKARAMGYVDMPEISAVGQMGLDEWYREQEALGARMIRDHPEWWSGAHESVQGAFRDEMGRPLLIHPDDGLDASQAILGPHSGIDPSGMTLARLNRVRRFYGLPAILARGGRQEETMIEAVKVPVPRAGWLQELTDDEYEVLRMKAEGWTIRETAQAMGCSDAWIKVLQHSVYEKMGILEASQPGAHAAYLFGQAQARGERR